MLRLSQDNGRSVGRVEGNLPQITAASDEKKLLVDGTGLIVRVQLHATGTGTGDETRPNGGEQAQVRAVSVVM